MQRIAIITALYFFNILFVQNYIAIAVSLPVYLMVLYATSNIKSKYIDVPDVFWFTVFVFFGLSPLQRMESDGAIGGADAVTRYIYSFEEYLIAGSIVVLFLIPFLFLKWGNDNPEEDRQRFVPLSILLFLSVVGFGAFVVAEGGLTNLLSPRLGVERQDPFIGSMAFLGLQLVATSILVGQVRYAKHRAVAIILALAAILLVVVSRNPFNASRFSLLAAWVPIVLALLHGRLRATHFYLIAVFALVVAFPILSVTSRQGVDALASAFEIDFSQNLLRIPFVDIFDTLVHAVRFASNEDLFLGQKIVAVVLFFVPRFMWPEKPIVGGLDIGNELYFAKMAGTPNLSFFLGGDFYLDFGLAGVCVGGLATAFILRRALRADFGYIAGMDFFKFVLIASLPILIRGPVGAVLALFTMQVLWLWVIAKLARPVSREVKG